MAVVIYVTSNKPCIGVYILHYVYTIVKYADDYSFVHQHKIACDLAFFCIFNFADLGTIIIVPTALPQVPSSATGVPFFMNFMNL